MSLESSPYSAGAHNGLLMGCVRNASCFSVGIDRICACCQLREVVAGALESQATGRCPD
jgi:hypothetical protein